MTTKTPKVLIIILCQFLWMFIITMIMKHLPEKSLVPFASGLVVLSFLAPTLILVTYRVASSKKNNYPLAQKRLQDALKHMNKGIPVEDEYNRIIEILNKEHSDLDKDRLSFTNEIIKKLGIKEDNMWETQDGRKIMISEMETSHIQSSLKVIEKVAANNGHDSETLQKHVKYMQLKNELEKRKLKG